MIANLFPLVGSTLMLKGQGLPDLSRPRFMRKTPKETPALVRYLMDSGAWICRSTRMLPEVRLSL